MGQGSQFERVAVLGAGAWGTALAQVAAVAGLDVTLWGRDPDLIDGIRTYRENRKYLPDVQLNERIRPIAELRTSLSNADLILMVIPAQSLRNVCQAMAAIVPSEIPLVVCAKGIEQKTKKFASEVVADILPHNPVAVLSGPSFAADVVRGLPTAVTIAAQEMMLAESIGQVLGTQSFRLYHSSDVRGVEIGGAAKNVLAIACGIAEGRGLGASAKAALIARGFAELRRFGGAYGADQETLMGLSGLGDLVLTCSSPQSRNFALGVALGEGRSVAEASSGKLAEGAFTARVLAAMAQESAVEMPIVSAVNAILNGELAVRDAIASLMMRPQRSESRTI
ncbi:MAG: NAD(P)-dependent glycerol-3-phosphate dehydrogenase [Hyphomicrobiales bacterium]|nr:NAD(P)-dependent glycerol-3-phosphate dehydrogenase [Hyphomicrobiales bacterium]